VPRSQREAFWVEIKNELPPSPPVKKQPATVNWAVRLLYLSVMLSIAGLFFELFVFSKVDFFMVALQSALFWAVLVWLIIKIDEGRHWAESFFLLYFSCIAPFIFCRCYDCSHIQLRWIALA
jgi:hypothetical protein